MSRSMAGPSTPSTSKRNSITRPGSAASSSSASQNVLAGNPEQASQRASRRTSIGSTCIPLKPEALSQASDERRMWESQFKHNAFKDLEQDANRSVAATSFREVSDWLKTLEESSSWKKVDAPCDNTTESLTILPSGKAASLLERRCQIENKSQQVDELTMAMMKRLNISPEAIRSWPPKQNLRLTFILKGAEGHIDMLHSLAFSSLSPNTVEYAMLRRRRVSIPTAVAYALGLRQPVKSFYSLSIRCRDPTKDAGYGALSRILSRPLPDPSAFHKEVAYAVKLAIGPQAELGGIPSQSAPSSCILRALDENYRDADVGTAEGITVKRLYRGEGKAPDWMQRRLNYDLVVQAAS